MGYIEGRRGLRRAGEGRRGQRGGMEHGVQAARGKERAWRLHEVDYILGIPMSFHIVPSNMTGAVSEG